MNLPLTPFIDKWGIFNCVVIYSEAYLQKHLLSGKWGLFKCTESVIQGLKKGTTKASASQRSVPAEYQGAVGYSVCVSTGCCDELPQTRRHELCVCVCSDSSRGHKSGNIFTALRAPCRQGQALWGRLLPGHFQFPELSGLLSLAHGPALCRDSLTAFSSLLLLYCQRAFLLFCLCGQVSPCLPLKQWGHWGLTQTVPISRSLITPGKCIPWCNIHKNWDPVTSEALYSLYRLGYNVLSAQYQALLGGWVGIWNLKISPFLHFLTDSYIYRTINMPHKCALEHWNPLYKGTNYQTLRSPDI